MAVSLLLMVLGALLQSVAHSRGVGWHSRNLYRPKHRSAKGHRPAPKPSQTTLPRSQHVRQNLRSGQRHGLAAAHVASDGKLLRQRHRPRISVQAQAQALAQVQDLRVQASAVCAAKCADDVENHHAAAFGSSMLENSATCIALCESSMKKLRAAAAEVIVGQARPIKFPSSSIVSAIPKRDTNREFNGIMFAGGVNVGGRDSFAARLCTNRCIDQTSAGLYSTVIFGDLADSKEGLAWNRASALDVPHNRTGWFVGPEDPRIDAVNDARFITANVNVEVAGCKAVKHEYEKPRQMFFAPVDTIPGSRPCLIQLEGVSPCRVQKNWAPLVPKDSSDIYYVYSLSPFRVLTFKKQACTASFTAQAVETQAPAGLEKVNGGTRFVHGISVPDGDVYFSFSHTAAPGYKQILTAVLVKHGTKAIDPTFQLIGMSCPIKFTQPATHPDGNPMMITTSIVNFDNHADLARITFQTHDSLNSHSEVRGIKAWLETTYSEFQGGGPVYCVPNAE